MLTLQILVIVLVLAGILFFQIRRFISADRDLMEYKNIFPETEITDAFTVQKAYFTADEIKTNSPKELNALNREGKSESEVRSALYEDSPLIEYTLISVSKMRKPHLNWFRKRFQKNIEYDAIISSINDDINSYLIKNDGAVSDYNIIKDIVERHCSSKEHSINIQQPVPLYLGLMGTMLGIIVGLGFLLASGDLESLIGLTGASSTGNGEGISNLLWGVTLAMVASFVGISLSTAISLIFRRYKDQLEKRKNHFYSWFQAEMLPVVTSDTTSVIASLTKNLVSFNKEFASNVSKMGDSLGAVSEVQQENKELLDQISKMDINKMSKANIETLKELQKASSQVEVFNEYLKYAGEYVSQIKTLTSSLSEMQKRTDTMEKVAIFFKEEQEQVATRRRDFEDGIQQLGEKFSETMHNFNSIIEKSMIEFGEKTAKSHDHIATLLIKQDKQLVGEIDMRNKQLASSIARQEERLREKNEEISFIVEELRGISSISTSIDQLHSSSASQSESTSNLARLVSKNTEQLLSLIETNKLVATALNTSVKRENSSIKGAAGGSVQRQSNNVTLISMGIAAAIIISLLGYSSYNTKKTKEVIEEYIQIKSNDDQKIGRVDDSKTYSAHFLGFYNC